MEITYLGHSAFKLKGKNLIVITDPFDASIGIKFPKIEADIVTSSHDHDDHNYISGVSEVKRVFRDPGEYEIAGVSFFGYPSFHDDKKGSERGKNTIFVIEMDGIKLCHLGDLGHTLSDSMVEAIGEIDVLFVPVGGNYTIGPKEAVDTVQAIEPKIVIPMHYKVAGLDEKVFGGLSDVDAFVSEVGIKREDIEGKTSIRSEDLPQEGERLMVFNLK